MMGGKRPPRVNSKKKPTQKTPPPLVNFKKTPGKTSDRYRCNVGISDYSDDEYTTKITPRLEESDNYSDDNFEEEEEDSTEGLEDDDSNEEST